MVAILKVCVHPDNNDWDIISGVFCFLYLFFVLIYSLFYIYSPQECGCSLVGEAARECELVQEATKRC